MTVTFTPFGVASEYSCRGWRPIGSSLSCVGPAIGRLMLANLPPLSLFQVQTFGGSYADVSVNCLTPCLFPSWPGRSAKRVFALLPGHDEVSVQFAGRTKVRLRRAHRPSFRTEYGGHAALCPPYKNTQPVI